MVSEVKGKVPWHVLLQLCVLLSFSAGDPGSSCLWHPPAVLSSTPTSKCSLLAAPVGKTGQPEKPATERGQGVDGQGWEEVSYLLLLQLQFPRPETLEHSRRGLPPGRYLESHTPGYLQLVTSLSANQRVVSLGFIRAASTRHPHSPRKAGSARTCFPHRPKEHSKKGPFLSQELLTGQRKERLFL